MIAVSPAEATVPAASGHHHDEDHDIVDDHVIVAASAVPEVARAASIFAVVRRGRA